MAYKPEVTDFHAKPFDDGTLVKLSLFKDYLAEWMPVFIAARKPNWHVVNILDFFAGPGGDDHGRLGSPLLILDALQPYYGQIAANDLVVNVVFNEVANWKIKSLKAHIDARYPANKPVHIEYSRRLFAHAFAHYRPMLDGAANLIFLDQTGMKQITDEIFRALMSIPATDFMFFISSSYIGRFADHPNFLKHVRFSKEAIRRWPYLQIHRAILEYYRSLIPGGQRFFLSGFSIKKGRNIYGLIFGSHHPYGMEKFLKTCWREDPERGEANYDIDEEGIDIKMPFFPGFHQPKKRDSFEADLKAGILSGRIGSDSDAYLFALQEGCLPEHARAVIQGLIEEGLIGKFRPRVSKDGWREPRPIQRI